MNHFKAIIAVTVTAGLMWGLWSIYKDFLTQGQKPPESTQILNEISKNGVPDFELNDIKGKTIKLSDFKNKIVIVNFWASWCDPCVEEFPSLLKLLNDFKGEIVLLAISADHSEEDMNNFLKAFNAESPYLYVMWDKEQEVAKKYGTSVLPESYVLGYDNKLIRKVAGVDDWSSPYAKEFFESIIKENKKN
ncbi:MAG: TlpA family protein disulfide reductase [Bdellovibrionales bacterium]|nr:TlpA family protein disulfide reductase [Bdellovibrionales bacterium]